MEIYVNEKITIIVANFMQLYIETVSDEFFINVEMNVKVKKIIRKYKH